MFPVKLCLLVLFVSSAVGGKQRIDRHNVRKFDMSPICANVPMPEKLEGMIKLCAVIYDIHILPQLHMCLDIQIYILEIKKPVMVLHFDCVNFGINGTSFQKAEKKS